jgi:cytochrome c oxidase subunit 2
MRRWGVVAAMTSAGIVLAGCLPSPATAEGRDVAKLYTGFLVVAAIVAAIVIIPTTWSIVRHRYRRGDPLPPQRYGNLRLELLWTSLPALTVIGLFIATLLVLVRVDPGVTRSATEVDVTAFRWGWTFQYPGTQISISGIGEPGPEVVVPVGEPVLLRMTSVDVIHSFYVPIFLFKRDANPGRQTTFQFTVDDPGVYRGQCAEFCGINHFRMPFAIRAVARPDYDAWLASQPAGSPEPNPSPAPSPGPS